MSREEMDGLEQELLAMSRATTYPATPDLAAGFWRRLEAERSRAPASALSFAGLAVAASVVVLSVIVATVCPARDAAADLFDRINVFETSEPLGDLPTDITGEETTITDAQIRLGQQIAQPSYPDGLALDKVLFQDFGLTKAAVVFYNAPGGTQFALFATNSNVGKGLPTGGSSTAEPVDGIGDGEAYWLEGERIVQYYGLEGNVISQSVRVTAANTLVWDQDGFVYRIEGNVPQDEAVRIAHSMEVH